MSDPVTATIQILQVAFTAVSAGAAIGKYVESRQANRQAYEATQATSTGYYRQSVPDIFLVLATIGQRLLHLGVINHAALPEARAAARAAFSVANQDDELGAEFDQSGEVMQYAITCAMVFCAECWPMHMWQGFGCGLMNDKSWAEPGYCNANCVGMDKTIAAFKSKPHEWQLLTKSPSRIGHEEPFLSKVPKSERKELVSLLKDIVGEYEKRGFPQPKAPHVNLKITTWWFPFSTWGASPFESLYMNSGHDYELSCKYQIDPGRLFYAWTAGRHAELRPGEAMVLLQNQVKALAEWLEGLNGMNFKILLDTEVDVSKLKYKSSTKKYLKKISGNEEGIVGEAFVMVGLPPPSHAPMSPVNKEGSFYRPSVEVADGAPPAYASTATTPVSPTGFPTPIRRRPVPRPPAAVKRVASATHTFNAMTEQELSFVAGESIEILDDSSPDGWWKGRLNGREGLIPNTYVQ